MPFDVDAPLPPIDDDLFDRARAAVSAIRGRGRRENGQAAPGNTIAVRTGLRSARLLNEPDIAQWHAERVAEIETDRGGPAELSALARATVREAARLEVILAALGDELLRNGPLSGKGKTRSATVTYLQVLDRFVRLATTIGLERKPRALGSLDDVHRAVEEANR